MILWINACVREESRTKRLAEHLLGQLGDYEEVNLSRLDLQPLNEKTLAERTAYIAEQDYDQPMFLQAKKFAAADTIVIAAPYWDLSFPALLKTYLENIYVTGLVSRYSADGRPEGLCRAKNLYYVTTAGGPYVPDYSYDYISRMAKDFFGIGETHLIAAEMLDVVGFDPETILREAEKKIDGMLG